MTVAHEGEVWRIRASQKFALIVFARPDEGERQEDLRVVPVYRGTSFLALATHRDIVVDGSYSTFDEPVVAACWNARGITSYDLDEKIGSVPPLIVEAARAVEMSCIIPGEPLGMFEGMVGQRPAGSEAEEVTRQFQVGELNEWNDLQRILESYPRTEARVLDESDYRMKSLRVGAPVNSYEEPAVHMRRTFMVPYPSAFGSPYPEESPDPGVGELELPLGYPVFSELPQSGQFLLSELLRAGRRPSLIEARK